MSDLSESGTLSDQSGDLPDGLEERLAASVYLTELKIGGPLEDICYQLTVQLAQARQGNKDLFEMMSNECERLRHRANDFRSKWIAERDIVSECLEDELDLEEQVELLKAESGYNIEALITAQERLDNALSMIDDLSPFINWNEMTK